MTMLRTLALLGLLVLPLAAQADTPAANPVDMIRHAKRIVCLGDSITHAGGWVAPFAAWLEREGIGTELINMGLPSETVSGLSEAGHADGKFPRPDLAERLDRVLRVSRPDLVIACYGMNCGIYQPLDEARFTKFKEGIQRLHDAVEKTGAKIIHLTPPLYDKRPDKPGPAGAADYDAVLDTYSKWLLSKRADGWVVLDIHGPMKDLLAAARAKDPQAVFAPDAVHSNDAGAWAFARSLFKGLGDHKAAAAETPEAFAAFVPDVKRRMEVLRDAYLAAAGHQRPGMAPGLPLGEAEAQARGLTESIRSRRLHLMGGQKGSIEWKNPIEWPKPRVVDPGPEPSGPAPVPSDAIVLFDGKNLDQWTNGGNWKVAGGIATVGKGKIETKQGFGDCQLHVEFRTAADTSGEGQQRSNSGVFLMGKYEIQILDSFQDGTDSPITYFDGQCGALYKQQPPAVNACRRPGEWQTYDILFTRPRFHADGTLAKPARISVLHNGVAIHSDTVIKGDTFFHAPPSYTKHDDALPIGLQEHGNPVQFRNIWVRPFEPLAPKLIP
ncbi:MAG: family 16 glycoside hydrolase [Planctomycetia bacterium]|jgi:lysophospholipase L1-like esterase